MFYEYKCTNCPAISEYQYNMGDAPIVVDCIECGYEMTRILNPTHHIWEEGRGPND